MSSSHDTQSRLRITFFVIVALLTVASTIFSNHLAKDLAKEEKKKIELWAEATRLFSADTQEGVEVDYTLSLKVIEGNTNIPVILADNKGNILEYKNLGVNRNEDPARFEKKAHKIMEKKKIIEVKLSDKVSQYVYYDESDLLKKLTYFPILQLMVMVVFLIVAIYALNTSKRAEQDRVWVGLSKETAHQLGTPISSLMAWVELLKMKNADDKLINEISKDTQRLKTIAERFSKIGSRPEPLPEVIGPALENAVNYIRSRSSKKIIFSTNIPNDDIRVYLDVPLFEWVIENLCKNAIDAMEATGRISINSFTEARYLVIDVSDTGKGIPKSKFKSVFKPGYTTKAHGWGLGLSLVKRIIEENHGGKIFVKNSEVGKGTTFRIMLKRA